jgi:hypothetical protein
MNEIIVTPGPTPTSVIHQDGKVAEVPQGWELLAPGDAMLTRRVKKAGECWVVQEKRGRKIFSRGIWASSSIIATIRETVYASRSSASYEKRKVADAKRREVKQSQYEVEFESAVLQFLNFHPVYRDLAASMARKVTQHAVPVGSGTVARTQQIPIADRAEAAVIAWMRHQTTAYDSMSIARVKGERRQVRRQLARQSHQLLESYRLGIPTKQDCLLKSAIEG